MPHKAERGDVDADLRREGSPQGRETGCQGAACGEYVVYQEDVADVLLRNVFI